MTSAVLLLPSSTVQPGCTVDVGRALTMTPTLCSRMPAPAITTMCKPAQSAVKAVREGGSGGAGRR